jgi:SAM-dependent methyltransferase
VHAVDRDYIAHPGYYEQFRQEIVALVPMGMRRVLEVGCATGATLAHLKKERGVEEAVGIEYIETVAREAQQSGRLDAVHCLDVQRDAIPYASEYFDCIIASHVLEHVQDPWGVLAKLLVHLRPGGVFICALPNVRYLPVVRDLVLKGRFDYADAGVLDRTHLRFFTLSTMEQLLQGAGLKIEVTNPEIHGKKARMVDSLSLGMLQQFAAYAYNFKCVKP